MSETSKESIRWFVFFLLMVALCLFGALMSGTF